MWLKVTMSDFSQIRDSLSQYEDLERKLVLKELQVKGLLAITQAINDNVSASGLFRMYAKFLEFEMDVPCMALFFQEHGEWTVMSQYGFEEDFAGADLDALFKTFERTSRLAEDIVHPSFQVFDIVVPVMHKQTPLAYAFIGGFGDKDDIYDKVHFITTITNVIAVAIENKRLFKKQMQQELVEKELEMASSIQQTLVPNQLPKGKNYTLASIYKPHFAVGGDYYDVVEFADGNMAFCIADVTGKGMSAALLMANFQANLHALLHRGRHLEEIVREINAAVFRVTGGDRFVTLFLAKYCPDDRSLHYINAGHPPPLVVGEDNTVLKLENGCTPLGWMPDIGPIEIGALCLTSPKSLLLSYTDGINDIQNSKGEYFEDGMIECFLQENKGDSPETLNNKLLKHLDIFRERVPFPDDLTVLTAQFY